MSRHISASAVEASERLIEGLLAAHDAFTNRTCLVSSAHALAEYAWLGLAMPPNDLDTALHDVASGAELCTVSFQLPAGDSYIREEDRIAITQLTLAAQARRNLDEGGHVDVKGLAALARVAEKTVRMATQSGRKGGMRVTKSGHWAYIEAPEALAWLSRRPDFHPTRPYLDAPALRLIVGAEDLVSACKEAAARTSKSSADLAMALGWTATQKKGYERLLAGDITDQATRFAPKVLYALAQAFELPNAKDFARQAFRVLAMKHADIQSEQQLAAHAD